MEGQIFGIFVVCAAFSVVFSTPLQQNPFQQQNYDNIPRCLQPKVTGMCLAYFPSYYYDSSKKTCEEFIYGGCGGSQNRFLTFEECMKTCEGAEPEEHDFKLVLPSETFDACSQPMVTGPCRAGMPRFYFNGDKCESFLYGGCEGNENNFQSLEECQQRCSNEASAESEIVQPQSENKSEEVAEEQPQSEEVAEEQPQSEEVAEEQPQSEEVAAEQPQSEEVEKNE